MTESLGFNTDVEKESIIVVAANNEPNDGLFLVQ